MVKKWDIFFANLNPTQGSEQRGSRPVLIISNNGVNDNLPIVTVLPFSSIKEGAKVYPTEVLLSMQETNLKKGSVVMIHQIRTISKERLTTKLPVATIQSQSSRNKINIAIKEYFDL